jgi:hypothetical protein
LLLEKEERDGWSGAGDDELRSCDDLLDSLRVKIKEKLQSVRQRMGRRLGEEGELVITDNVGFGQRCLQMGGTSARDFAAASLCF